MITNSNEKICAHTACSCPVDADSDYCSVECEDAGNETDCSCGHVECRAIA